jgi:thiol-disulfide isomerase/thioredoxin
MKTLTEILTGVFAAVVIVVLLSGIANIGLNIERQSTDGPVPLTEAEFAKLQADLRKKRNEEKRQEEKAPNAVLTTVIVLDFYANWCAPCRAAVPTIALLEREGYTVIRYDMDVEGSHALAKEMNVRSLPTFVVTVTPNERPLKTTEALRTQSARQLRDWLHKNHPRHL